MSEWHSSVAASEEQDAAARSVAARLEAVFTKVHQERMDGVPILNERLRVEAVGAHIWNKDWLAVLVTPWFINLMLMPTSDDAQAQWRPLSLGSTVPHSFPAGRFDFIVGEEAELGRYQMCSLFSPVLEFEDQEAAVLTARAALEALFNAELDEERKAELAQEQAAASGATTSTLAVTRRDLLRGQLKDQEVAKP